MTDDDPEGLEPLAPEAFAEMLGWRADLPEDVTPLAIGDSTLHSRPWPEVISQRGHAFCVRWETGGKAYYEGVIKRRPVWPGFASGVTIGCGYDLGYHTLAQLRSDWGGRIGEADLSRLEAAIGLKTVDPDKAGKTARVKAFIQAFADIRIDWDVAIQQFDQLKMPALVAELYLALDNLDRLHPHSRAALLSLTFNRGSGGFRSAKDRYREMRAIAAAMSRGTPAAFAEIPGLLRSMRRIWGAASSLSQRRSEEAELFEAGLAEQAINEAVVTAVTLESTEQLVERHEDVAEQTDLDPVEGDALVTLEATGAASLASVKWNPNDDEQPDYRHLPRELGAGAFVLDAEVLEALVRWNRFQTKPGLLVFALRGARIEGAEARENVSEVVLSDIRPDHRDFRCVIGVLNRDSGRIWAYRASTVPNAKAVLGCFNLAHAGASLVGNILPTGCYTYTVGTHKAGHPTREIRGVLRLSNAATGASEVIVLRSVSDVVYDRRDMWDLCAPADNIHPGRLATGFSSEGCLTFPGNYRMADQSHSGLWASFRAALGLGAKSIANENGRQFSCMLLTGLDAALAAGLKASGQLDDPVAAGPKLSRLRFGSIGPEVAKVQALLGLAPDASQKLGPVTRQALIHKQQARLGWADGIWSDDMQALLGL
jgi:hypothetical protein